MAREKNSVIKIILLFVVLICCVFALTSCNMKKIEPYYGTYYGGNPNDANVVSITIEKNGVYISDNKSKSYSYTYSNGELTLESGVKICIAENNRVAYYSIVTQNFQGSINTRNGYFSSTLLDISNGQVQHSYQFNYEGSADGWSKIIGNSEIGNTDKLYYYSVTVPTDDGNYWYYDTDETTPVVW